MTKVVIDTNTLISAMGWKNSKPRKIIEGCLYNKWGLVESIDLLREFIEVIQRPKFNFISEEDKKEFLINLMNICDFVEPKKKLELIKDDPDDNIVLECALEGNVDYIISGDEHLLKLKKFENIKIVSSDNFLKIISKCNDEKN
jgi:putative PIN family toxin of toxin-antitoxin system